jgi:hypothetical protein
VQENYATRLKKVEDCGIEHDPGKRLKLGNGKGRAVPEDVVVCSEEAADWVLLNPQIWSNDVNPCVRSSEYHWFKCESDEEFIGFIDVIGQIDSNTYGVQNGASVYHPSTCLVAEDVTTGEPGPRVGKTKRGFYCVKVYHDCVREYLKFLRNLQAFGDLSVVE